MSRGGWLAASWQVGWLVCWPAGWLPGQLAGFDKQPNLFPKSWKSHTNRKKSKFSFENTGVLPFSMIFQGFNFLQKVWKVWTNQGFAVKTHVFWAHGFKTLMFSKLNLDFFRLFRFWGKVEILSRGGWLAASWQVDWRVGWPAGWLPVELAGWLRPNKQIFFRKVGKVWKIGKNQRLAVKTQVF